MLKSKSQQGVWKMVAPDMKLDHEVLPYTPHATSSTLHPAPYTLHPKPDPEATRSSTLRSTPRTNFVLFLKPSAQRRVIQQSMSRTGVPRS